MGNTVITGALQNPPDKAHSPRLSNAQLYASDTLFFLREQKSISTFLWCCAILVTAIGCGSPGIPLPPTLGLPKPVSDLRAVRKGNEVYLEWTPPTQTTDRQVVRHLGPTHICRTDTTMKECVIVAESKSAELASSATKTTAGTVTRYVDRIPASALANVFGNLTYAVEVPNHRGQSAGLSNLATVSSTPTLPPPTDLVARVAAGGIVISWAALPITPRISGLQYMYRIYRRENAAKSETVAGEIELDPTQTAFVDHNFHWEKQYSYRVTSVTIIHRNGQPDYQIEGDDSQTLTIFTHDVFPPAVPSRVQAVFSNGFVDLIWDPSSDSNLAGYNVYRRESGSSAVKINSSLLQTPAFRDFKVSPGKSYFYSVSSVDVRENESVRSEEAAETIPKNYP